MGALVYISKFEKMKDIKMFSEELIDAWSEEKYEIIDHGNKWWSDEIEYEYYTNCAVSAGLDGWEVDYLLYCLGY